MKNKCSWMVYILRCKNGKLYTGISANIAARLAKHRRGRGSKAVRGAGGPDLILYQVAATDRREAAKLEYAIKQTRREVKQVIVESQPSLKELRDILEPKKGW
jgi:putative endonuclease